MVDRPAGRLCSRPRKLTKETECPRIPSAANSIENGKIEQTPRFSTATLRGRFAESLLNAADRNQDGFVDRDEFLEYYKTHRNYISLESRQGAGTSLIAELPLYSSTR